MTRYERIKKMSIDEMVKFIDKCGVYTDEICWRMGECPYMDDDGNISTDCDCKGCIKKWLESEETHNEK